MSNLLKETLKKIADSGLKAEDVLWCSTNNTYLSWEDFEKASIDLEYDNGYGRAEVPQDLKVVFKDCWLERREYDGAEWWEANRYPTKPDTKASEIKLQEG